MPHQQLSHTADVRLKVSAKNKESLFKEALKGMMGILKEKPEKGRSTSQEIEIESFDQTSLLVDFLNEGLYNAYSEKAVYYDAEFTLFGNNKLRAKLIGYKIKDGFDEDIKAATYHEAEIKKENENFTVTLVFDI